MGKQGTKIAGGVLLSLCLISLALATTLADNFVTSESASFTVYFDGYVLVNQKLLLNQSIPTINVALYGESHENLLVLDREGLPLSFSLVDGEIVIDSLGTTEIQVAYFTQDLTSKTGKYWTLRSDVRTSATVMLPENASVISLNVIPDLIETFDNQVKLVMPAGTIEVTYVAEHSSTQNQQEEPQNNTQNNSNNTQTNSPPPTTEPQGTTTEDEKPATSNFVWPAVALLLVLVSLPVSVFWALRRRNSPIPFVNAVSKGEVDIEKLFSKNKNLRQEEVQVIRFLTEKGGTALEAELYAVLNLPRTTTWRLIKRLEKMEIVNVEKSRKQNVVSIRQKYMKKEK